VSEILRSFRRNAAQLRLALAAEPAPAGSVRLENGLLQDGHRFDRYKALSIPVRRALNPGDRASFVRAVEQLRITAGADLRRLKVLDADWRRLHVDLEASVALGSVRLTRGRILSRWLDAAAFYDRLDRDRAYDRLLDEWGAAAESIGVQLAHETAGLVTKLDEAAAACLEEPIILPPPARAAPPPVRGGWWALLLARMGWLDQG
jgi:hypothetical protein